MPGALCRPAARLAALGSFSAGYFQPRPRPARASLRVRARQPGTARPARPPRARPPRLRNPRRRLRPICRSHRRACPPTRRCRSRRTRPTRHRPGPQFRRRPRRGPAGAFRSRPRPRPARNDGLTTFGSPGARLHKTQVHEFTGGPASSPDAFHRSVGQGSPAADHPAVGKTGRRLGFIPGRRGSAGRPRTRQRASPRIAGVEGGDGGIRTGLPISAVAPRPVDLTAADWSPPARRPPRPFNTLNSLILSYIDSAAFNIAATNTIAGSTRPRRLPLLVVPSSSDGLGQKFFRRGRQLQHRRRACLFGSFSTTDNATLVYSFREVGYSPDGDSVHARRHGRGHPQRPRGRFRHHSYTHSLDQYAQGLRTATRPVRCSIRRRHAVASSYTVHRRAAPRRPTGERRTFHTE